MSNAVVAALNTSEGSVHADTGINKLLQLHEIN